MFSEILKKTNGVQTCLEIGANRGVNLMALANLLPDIKMQAIEINKNAAEECGKIRNVSVFNGSVFDFLLKDNRYDLAFTCGVLIHISPEKLNEMYEILYKASKRYILVAEYYNPSPVEVLYRGNAGKLFKRDFAGEIMDKFKDVELVDYGFIYHRDNMFPLDDITWFLMKKEM